MAQSDGHRLVQGRGFLGVYLTGSSESWPWGGEKGSGVDQGGEKRTQVDDSVTDIRLSSSLDLAGDVDVAVDVRQHPVVPDEAGTLQPPEVPALLVVHPAVLVEGQVDLVQLIKR